MELLNMGASAGSRRSRHGGWIAPVVLFAVLIAAAAGLAWWKMGSIKKAAAAAASQPEPMESVTTAVAKPREYRRHTTAIGTVVALRSITLQNELPGTVREVMLKPGEIVEAGKVLVALDVSVEEAELKAMEAQAALAETQLARMQKAVQTRATSEMEVDRARSERDVAQAQIARAKAIIERKTIRAPFKARVGLANVHPGQYLEAGAMLTTLQGVDESIDVDFNVPQHVGSGLRPGDKVEVSSGIEKPIPAEIIALDSRVDANTRNVMVRARVNSARDVPPPGASVRVRIPTGPMITAVSVPVSALRKGPGGDHVFVIEADKDGKPRAHPRMVETGAMLGDEVLIVTGLKAGEQVGAAGSFKLREGVLVAIATNANPAAAGMN